MKNNHELQKKFPEGMKPLGKSIFRFDCHAGVSCFTSCCAKLNLLLYPYDLIRLKKRLQVSSEVFLAQYVKVVKGGNPFFPSVVMRMTGNQSSLCPFLDREQGCMVYEDRPSSCRTYPLERAVDRTVTGGRPAEFYFLTNHYYCKGHEESKEWTVKKWLQNQGLRYYNVMDDLWAEMDTLFAGNPWQGEGAAGSRQLLAFMVCYNIDHFRQYMVERDLLNQFRMDKSRLRIINNDDEALLRFGFDWLKFILTGEKTLRVKNRK